MENFTPNEKYMARALTLAQQAAAIGEVPVGAVVVHKPTERILGEGYNRRESLHSPLAHAELLAIAQACQTVGGWRLLDSAIYVTLEPCPMCAGAILHARLDQVIFGTRDPKSGSLRSVQELYTLPYNWKPEIYEGLLQEDCATILTDFFRELRKQKKRQKSTECR